MTMESQHGQGTQLERAVREALADDERVRIDDLEVTERDGAVMIAGRAADIRAKRLAVNAVWNEVRKQREIVDHIRVQARQESERELEDEIARLLIGEGMFSNHTVVLHTRGGRKVLHDAGAEAPSLEVHLEGAVATLRGRVPSLSHRRFAEVLVWWAPGCERVDNRLQVEPPEEDTDNELNDAVRMVLEKDPLVRATQLSVGTAGGIVEIRGLAGSEQERRCAVLDAWYVPGTWSVVDHIEVEGTSQPGPPGG
jgi:osmotically-inducible protein OsmY